MTHKSNVVSTVDLMCRIELRKVVMYIRNAEYNPKRFPGVVIRIREPRVVCIVFRNGKLVTTGSKSIDTNNLAARKCARILQKLGFSVQFYNYKVENLVALADLRFPIRLEGVLMANEHLTQYEPEVFPGLVFRILKPKITVIIFVSGKILFTGGKSIDSINEAFNSIVPVLKNHRKVT
ncbi:TATA-binding protein [Cichlidogyrus casuarinus]|uniref:TATA-binding protein n=1 Tax=Cichlidogyrus casuarinus TaxID=1844966 RepID=A0ABD2QF04_9PLAT